MKTILASVCLFLLSAPAFAAGAPACENTLASVTAMLDAQEIQHKLLPADRVQGFVDEVVEPMVGSEINNVTNVLVAVLNGTVVFGLEFADGCLTNPVAIPGATALPVSNV